MMKTISLLLNCYKRLKRDPNNPVTALHKESYDGRARQMKSHQDKRKAFKKGYQYALKCRALALRTTTVRCIWGSLGRVARGCWILFEMQVKLKL